MFIFKCLGSAVRTKISRAVGSVSNLCRAMVSLTFVRNSNVPMAQGLGQQGSEALDRCSKISVHLYFLIFHGFES